MAGKNPFRDESQHGLNPYEPPVIQAELARPEQQRPPQAKKPRAPYLSFALVVFGPLLLMILVRFLIHQMQLFDTRDAMYYLILLTAAMLWIIAAIRSLWWLLFWSWKRA